MRRVVITFMFVVGWFGTHSSFAVDDQATHKSDGNEPWMAVAQLEASEGRKNDEFGYSVATNGDTIVVGAPYATVSGRYAQGAAFVFLKSGKGWIRKAKLTASDGAVNAFFGSAVAINGNTIVVGADGANLKTHLHAGAAYVFVKPTLGWANMTQTAKLTAPDEAAKAFLGSSIAIDGNTVAVGADGAAVGTSEFQGAVYVFLKPAHGWVSSSKSKAKLTASDGTRGDQLGYSLSMSGNTIVAGARSAAIGPNLRQGAAYVFTKAAQAWMSQPESAKLTATDGNADDQLGTSVAMEGKTVTAGAPGAGPGGAVYVFEPSVDGWVKNTVSKGKLTAADGVRGDQLGYSVAISGDTVVAGARSASIASNARQGAVYIYSKPETGWASATQSFKPGVPKGAAGDGIGSTVSISGRTMVAGAVFTTVASKKYQGSVHVFSATPPHSSRQ